MSKSLGRPILYIKIVFSVMNLGLGFFYLGEQRKIRLSNGIHRVDAVSFYLLGIARQSIASTLLRWIWQLGLR